MKYIYIADLIILLVSFSLAYLLRNLILATPIQPPEFYVVFVGFSLAAFITSFVVFRLYETERSMVSISYLVDFLRASSLWIFSIIAFSFFTKTDYSRPVVLLYFLIGIFLVYVLRFFLLRINNNYSEKIHDPDVTKALNEIVKISSLSQKDLSLIEGIRLARAPGELQKITKRSMDITLATLGIIITLPLYPIIIYLIRRDSRGPAIISQKRIGEKGKVFTLYKFRTMKSETDLYGPLLFDDSDPRTTEIGKKLRKYSIDEIPQFWNVLIGNMSIVGPRPELHFIVEEYDKWQEIRHCVKPGITGIWQILGRKDIGPDKKVEYDLYYIYNQSLFFDLAIILRTIPHLVFPKGAY